MRLYNLLFNSIAIQYSSLVSLKCYRTVITVYVTLVGMVTGGLHRGDPAE